MTPSERYFKRRRHPEWGWFLIGDTHFCVPKKNGSTSFRFRYVQGPMAEFLKSYQPVSEVKEPAYLAVRDPIERFAALWRTCQISRDFEPFRGISPDDLLDVIEGHLHDDAHWCPQSDYWVEGAELVPYRDLLEMIGAQWTNRGIGETELPVERIRRVYAADYRLLVVAGKEADLRT